MSQPPLSDEDMIKLKRILDEWVDLSPEDIHAMRSIVEHDRRAKWLWASIRNLAVWVVAVIGGISLTYESLMAAVRHLAGK